MGPTIRLGIDVASRADTRSAALIPPESSCVGLAVPDHASGPGKGRALRAARRRGTEITEAQGRAICAERYKVTAGVRAARKRASSAQQLKKRAGRGSKEPTKAAPASDPPGTNASPGALVA